MSRQRQTMFKGNLVLKLVVTKKHKKFKKKIKKSNKIGTSRSVNLFGHVEKRGYLALIWHTV